MSAILSIVTSLTVLGPGALAPAHPGVLERVELVRVKHGYGLGHVAGPEVVKLAVEDCNLLGYTGWLVVENCGVFPVTVIDCEADVHRGMMAANGILADVNDPSLGHRQAYLLLWQEPSHPKPTYANQGE